MDIQGVALPSERKFGGFFAAVFLLAAAYSGWQGAGTAAMALSLLGAAFGACSLFVPGILRPLNKLWFRLGLLMARVMNPLVLGVIFFILITPIAMITRWGGRDALRLKRRPVSSYWIDRELPLEAESFKQQF